MEQAYGAPVQRIGDGGSIPFAAAVAAVHPEVEILLIGVEEPLAGIHGPDVRASTQEEIRRTALAEAIFLAGWARRRNLAETSVRQDHAMDRQEEFVLRTIEERDIRFVRLWFTDVLGT